MEYKRSYDPDNNLDNCKLLLSNSESRKASTRQKIDRIDRKKGTYIIFPQFRMKIMNVVYNTSRNSTESNFY